MLIKSIGQLLGSGCVGEAQQSLGPHEIDPTGEKGPESELAGAGTAGTEPIECVYDCFDTRDSPQAVNLGRLLACVTCAVFPHARHGRNGLGILPADWEKFALGPAGGKGGGTGIRQGFPNGGQSFRRFLAR